MALDSHILTILEPKVKLEEIKISNLGERVSGDAHSSFQGGTMPFIRVNGYTFQTSDILKFTLDTNGKYPEVRAIIRDSQNVFTVDRFPRDGDILNLRIELDKAGTYKDIRMDFIILEFKGLPTGTTEKIEGDTRFNVRAIAKIPGMYTDECKSYSSNTSLEHIKAIATDLQIGVATNVEASSDEMTRFCAYQTKLDFLDKTVLHSYISDDSFLTYSIDPYYYINFVNLQKIFNAPNDIEKHEMITTAMFDERGTDPKDGAGTGEIDLVLTNHINTSGQNSHISKFGLINNSTKVALENGYRRKMQYFNIDEESLLEFDVESLVSDNLGDREEALKGRRNDDNDEYDTHIKQKYVGLQNSNTHANYNYAAINNIQNMVELDKMYLEVELESINPAIYKYMKVPVYIYNSGIANAETSRILKEDAKEKGFDTKEDTNGSEVQTTNEEPPMYTIDEFLTGHYIIIGIKYVYDYETGYKQILKLARREWPARLNNI